MLRVLRRILKRAPLLVMILFIWFLLTVPALIARGRAYRNYSTEHGRLPALSVVMRGIHDHVYPWSGEPQTRAAETGDFDKEDAADASGPAEAEVKEAEAKGSRDTEAEGAEDAAEGTPAQQISSESREPAAQPEPAVSLTIPDTSCSKVVGAKDYGVADRSYLSSEDTVYNTDKEGLFAPDGTYYSLQEVDDSYFADALLIGDSRTAGLYEYGGMADVTSFLARESATIYDLFDDDEKMMYAPKGKGAGERTLKGLLSGTEFKKIYISVGVNELGVPDTKDYYNEFREVITRINRMQPDAIIYIQGIMHVSKKISSTDSVYNNKAIVQRNKAIATLANGRNVFYIDMNADLCDENGDLRAELTGDGIHLKAAACKLWRVFLRKNAIVVPSAAGTAPADRTPAARRSAGKVSGAQPFSEQPLRDRPVQTVGTAGRSHA